MKICLLTTIHAISDLRVFHKEAKSLAKEHEVILIAPSDERIKRVVDGVQIITIKKPKQKVFRPIMMRVQLLITGFSQNCDAYLCYEPDSLLICSFLKIIKRKKVIYDAHEYYPGALEDSPLFPGFVRPLARFAIDMGERILCRFADVVMTTNDTLRKRYKKYNDNIVIIENYPKMDLFQYKEYSTDIKDKFNGYKCILYTGGFGISRGALKLVEAMQKVVKKQPNTKLVFLGNINRDDYERIKQKYSFDCIEVIGTVPYEKVADYINTADVCVELLQPIPRFVRVVATKIFEYMACGKPIVTSDFPEIRKVIEDAKCGILVDPTNASEIADAIIYLLEHPEEGGKMEENGRKAFEERYNWEKMEERLLKIWEKQ